MIDYSYDPQDRAANLARMFREDVLSFAYAATGAVLGVLAGIAVATNAIPARVHAESHSVAVASSSSAVLNLDARGVKAPVSVPPEQGPAAVAVTVDPISPSVATTATSNKQHAPSVAKSEFKSLIINNIKDGGALSSMESAPGSEQATASSMPLAANLDAKVDKLAQPSHFRIEGDATVVDYDEPQGVITTDAATTFAIAKTGNKGSDSIWADFPVTVHYKCDGAENCTLYHAGVLVAQASRPIQSDRLTSSVASVQMGQSSVPQDLQQMRESSGTR